MIPYFDPPAVSVAGFTLHAFSVTTALAVVTGVALVIRRAPHHGIPAADARHIVVWTVVSGFIGAHLFAMLLYFPRQVLSNPLSLLHVWGSMSSFGGMIGGIAGTWWVMSRQGWPAGRRLDFLDLVAWAFPFAWLFGRLGCFLVHDHIGVPSTHWLAVDFPDGPRWDLGLLELLATVPIALLFLVLARRPRPRGTYLGLFFVAYCPVRFALDSLRVADLRHGGLTPAQWVCAAGLAGGVVLLWHAWRHSSGGRV